MLGRPIMTGLAALSVLVLLALGVALVVSRPSATKWLVDNKDALGSLSSLASTAGLLLTGVGVVFAGYQLRRQRDTMQATAMYDVMKDARAEGSLTKEASVRAASNNATEEHKSSFRFQAGRLLNLYAAAYQLRKGRVLSESQWSRILDDLVITLANDEVIEDRWTAIKDGYDNDFVDAVEAARGRGND